MNPELTNLITTCQSRMDNLFSYYLKERKSPAPLLSEAMAYGVCNGGKRIRPLLVYATGLALGANIENLDPAAAAVELIHSYSLIHDDLPAMDNADMRRGKPSCHKVYGEALAILAGDALQTLAFRIIIAHPSQIVTQQRLDIIKVLSEASGIMGMASGQALDIEGKETNLDGVLQLYKLKTGALLEASVKMGMLSAGNVEEKIKTALDKYATCLGLAFQLQDDLLDSEAGTGKPQGLDEVNGKSTYSRVMGVEKTKEKIRDLNIEAVAALEVLGGKADILREVAEYLGGRRV